MSEPITISEEARKAASELNTQDLAIIEHEMPWVEEVIQLAINSATTPLQKRIEELQSKLTTYEGKTNFCCECGGTKARIEELEKQLLAMREALKLTHDKMLNWFSSEYAAHPDTVRVSELLAATPSDLASKYVKREVLEKCVDCIEKIGSSNHNLECPDCCLCEAVDAALAFAQKELEK